MNVLVTGGAGYIGSHVCKALKSAGFLPIVYDNMVAGHGWAVKWGPLVQADLADSNALKDALHNYEVGAVIHLAAFTAVGDSVRNPRRYFTNNVGCSLTLLDEIVESKVPFVVFSSTAAVFGDPQIIPIPEEHPKVPASPYGESKLFVERLLTWYGQAYGLKHVSLRYFNACGADPEGDVGELHTPETHLVPLAIRATLESSANLQVFGTDYPTKDGTAIRDYVHVADLADAHVRALQYLIDGGESTEFNLGSGEGYSVRDIIRTVERISGLKVPIVESERRPGDPPKLVADSSKAKSILKWKPTFTDLNEIVKTAWYWHKSRN